MNIQTLPREPREIGQFREGYAPLEQKDDRPLSEAIAEIRKIPCDGPDIDLIINGPKRLDVIAALIGKLTYGEMTDLAAAIWRAKPNEGELDLDMLPGTLHRWATK